MPFINTCPFINALNVQQLRKLKPRSYSYNLRIDDIDLSLVHKASSPAHLADRAHLEPLPIQHLDLAVGSLASDTSDSSSIDGSAVAASPMMGIVDRFSRDNVILVHAEAKNWRGTFEAASSVKTEQQKRDKLAEELINHLSRYTKKQMVQRV